jgi:hypothetical protein
MAGSCEHRMQVGVKVLIQLGYTAVYSAECQPTFGRNISPPSSGSKSKPSKKTARNREAITAAGDVLPKRRLTFNRLDGGMSQNIVLFMLTKHREP